MEEVKFKRVWCALKGKSCVQIQSFKKYFCVKQQNTGKF